MNKPILYYVYDPMCSWCWGYRETWIKLTKALAGQVDICYQLGGLAPDSDAPMADSMQQTLKTIWLSIHKQLGTEFNFDFWQLCRAQRSTYPACRACLIAREFSKEKQMLFAIQKAYYLHAKNPSLTTTLIALAEEIGIDKVFFAQQINNVAVKQQLLQEIERNRQRPIQGFPSLVLSINGQEIAINIDYLDWEKTVRQVQQLVTDSNPAER